MNDQIIDQYLSDLDQMEASEPHTPRQVYSISFEYILDSDGDLHKPVRIYYEGWDVREENGKLACDNDPSLKATFRPDQDVLDWMMHKLTRAWEVNPISDVKMTNMWNAITFVNRHAN